MKYIWSLKICHIVEYISIFILYIVVLLKLTVNMDSDRDNSIFITQNTFALDCNKLYDTDDAINAVMQLENVSNKVIDSVDEETMSDNDFMIATQCIETVTTATPTYSSENILKETIETGYKGKLQIYLLKILRPIEHGQMSKIWDTRVKFHLLSI